MRSNASMEFRLNLTYQDGSKRSVHGFGSWPEIIEIARFMKKYCNVKKIRVKKEKKHDLHDRTL